MACLSHSSNGSSSKYFWFATLSSLQLFLLPSSSFPVLPEAEALSQDFIPSLQGLKIPRVGLREGKECAGGLKPAATRLVLSRSVSVSLPSPSFNLSKPQSFDAFFLRFCLYHLKKSSDCRSEERNTSLPLSFLSLCCFPILTFLPSHFFLSFFPIVSLLAAASNIPHTPQPWHS